MDKFIKYDNETGRRTADEMQPADVPYYPRARTLLGKVLLQLNALKRRALISNNARWEIQSGYYLISGWASGSWNPVLFGKEVLRGDNCRITSDRWIFRAQIAGTYLITSSITIAADSIQDASLGIFKNGTIWSRAKTVQARIRDFNDTPPVWLYHATVDLNGGVDQVYLKEGDEIDIRVYYVADVTGGGISKISGYVNAALIGNNGKIINSPTDTW